MAQTPPDMHPQPQPRQQEDCDKEPEIEELIRTNLLGELDMNLDKRKLPFDDSLFEAGLRHHTSYAANILSKQKMLDWLESDSVLPILKQWKTHVVDQIRMRCMIENGFTLDYQNSWDTIDTMIHLCFAKCEAYAEQGPDLEMSADDGFEATVLIAARLVVENHTVEDCPFTRMVENGELKWCYSVAVRLLVCVICDLRKSKNSYFSKLLGGPEVQKIDQHKYRGWLMRIDNRPVSSSRESEVHGEHGMKAMMNDYPWLKDY